jgi:hypothetical protein
MSEKPLSYVGIAPCGCVRYAICGTLPAKDINKAIGEILNYGLDLQRMSTEDVRQASWSCPICDPPKPSPVELQVLMDLTDTIEIPPVASVCHGE